ncbi:MAG: ribonuclease R [Clostridia bacterium]|nr:ribonuclease R [Clostridia bacterium]
MRTQILDALRAAAAPMSLKALAALLGASDDALKAECDRLEREGSLVETKKGRYALPEAVGLFTAHIAFTRSGAPLARPVGGGEGVPVEVTGTLRGMPDDRVLARHTVDGCVLHRILERGSEHLPAYVRLERRQPGGLHDSDPGPLASAVPCDVRIPYAVTLTGDLSGVANDDIALLHIERYPERDRPILASVERVLGDASSMKALLRAVAEAHGFSTVTEDAAAFEAADFPSVIPPEEQACRTDLRGLDVFTIDGETAKDFDDAVSIERTAAGFRLGVHIADVSHYVRPGTAIDADALRRGTSLYLPGLTVPMLPERLCNELCSLMPDVDRLALSLFMVIEDGTVTDHQLVRSVIHSRARLTYRAVNRLFDGDDAGIAPRIADALQDMRALSQVLRTRRRERGAIDFDMDEPEFLLDANGEPSEILCEPRGEAERIIEDFMLAANETVAALARNTELPFVYRIHEPPDADRIRAFERLLDSVGLHVRLGADPHPGQLQKILAGASDHPAYEVIRNDLLRSLKRAQYSDKPLGHYAMALSDYCHFTSPIRRYPDLIVHRMLKLLIDGDMARAERQAGLMPALAQACSQRENSATLAERQGDGIMMAAYMSHRIGQLFNGVISSVTSWGFYVTLPNRVEGLVRISSLDGYYVYDAERARLVNEATGAAFTLGDRVCVRMERASVPAGEIDFSLRPLPKGDSE